MKTFISILAVTLALAFTGPAFAGNVKAAKTESDCRMADGQWDKMNKVRREKDVSLTVALNGTKGRRLRSALFLVPCGNRACMAGLSYPRL